MRTDERLEAPIHTAADLYRLWEALIGPEGFDLRTLWLIFLDSHGYPFPVIMPIEPLPDAPDEKSIVSLHRVVADLGAESPIAAVPGLLSRPGPAGVHADDRRWALALRARAPRQLTRWPLHLATPGRLSVIAPDDLIAG